MSRQPQPITLPRRPFESLYLHVPFCEAKCGYCAFYSTPQHDAGVRRAYLAQATAELEEKRYRCAPLTSVFIGGGTPSVLTPSELRLLLGAVVRHTTRTPDCEWTVEANPESLTPEKISLLRDAGVNRVSLGVQTFLPRHRATLQRRGSLDVLPETVDRLLECGICDLNMDLIYAIPWQSPDEVADDLLGILRFPVTHAAAYALTVEEQTGLAHASLQLPDDEIFLAMWNTTAEILGRAGLRRYEISNFARPGNECRHNSSVWHGATYLGVGPAATSFDGSIRYAHPADLQAWLAGAPPETDAIPPLDRAAEILAFGLRTLDGWNCRQYREMTGLGPYEVRGDAIRQLRQQGLLRATADAISPTEKGLLFNDIVLETIL